jgi:hypothetical protein
MRQTFGGDPAALWRFIDQAKLNKVALDNIRNCARRKTEARRQDVEPDGSAGVFQDTQQLDFLTVQTEAVDTFQFTGAIEVPPGDRILELASTGSTAGFQEAKRQSRCPTTASSNQRENIVGNIPAKRVGALMNEFAQLGFAILLEAQDQLHPVAEGLDEAMLMV